MRWSNPSPTLIFPPPQSVSSPTITEPTEHPTAIKPATTAQRYVKNAIRLIPQVAISTVIRSNSNSIIARNTPIRPSDTHGKSGNSKIVNRTAFRNVVTVTDAS